MKSLKFITIQGLLALVLWFAIGSSALAATPPTPMALYVGEAKVLNLPGISRMAIGNGKVVAATVLDDRQVLLLAEAPGQSTLYLWDKKGVEREFSISVVPADLSRLLTEVRSLLPSGVAARIVGDKVVLEGANLSDENATRVREIAKRYPQVVNLLSNHGLERMVMMDVKIVEINKKALQDIGVNWNKSFNGPMFGIVGDLKTNRYYRSTPGAASGQVESNFPDATGAAAYPSRVKPFAAFLGIATSIGSIINLLETQGDAYILASPKLSCRSGGVAKFAAGGEIPIPVVSAMGQSSVTFKPYGILFDIKPVASESGLISAQIATEISAIDPTLVVGVEKIPAFLTRRTETEVSLRENETLVISGLISDDTSKSIEKVAGLGDIPILGQLFRSKQFRQNETELVFFVTPTFVPADSEANRAAITRSEEQLTGARERMGLAK